MAPPDKPSSFNGPTAEIDRLVHEPARYLIMAYLYVVESADFMFIKNQTQLSQGNLSSHIAKLEAAQYIKIEKKILDKRTHTLLALTDTGRSAFLNYRQNMKQLFDELTTE